jgi:hypothetical protein
MVKFGKAPFYECSSKGDKRFSAFWARLKCLGGKSIEEVYQASKVFENGLTGLSWKDAKGKKPVNVEEVRKLYADLWDEYFKENPEFVDVIIDKTGFSDIYGQVGHACQAEEVWRIKNKYLEDGQLQELGMTF